MEEIDKRLRDATDACLAAHAEWDQNKKNGPMREKLQEAVHELRKVAARLEIEIAISERDEMAAKPLPIPPHRSSRKRPGEFADPNDDDGGNGFGNDMGGSGNQSGQQGAHESGIARTMRRRRPHGGGGGGGGGQPQGNQSPAGQGGGISGQLSTSGNNGNRGE